MKRAWVLAVLLPGCYAADDGCPEIRTLWDGQCCAPWAVADLDVCIVSEFATPAADASIGPPGARDPEVVLDSGERAVVAWVDSGEATTSIRVAMEDDDGDVLVLDPGQALTGNGSGPSLAADARGRVLLSWRQHEGDAGRVVWAQRESAVRWAFPAGEGGEGTQPLSFEPNAYEPRSVYGEDGETLVVFNQWTGDHFGVAVARRDPEDESGPLHGPKSATDVLSPAVLFSNAPMPAVARNGDGIIAWYQSPDADLMTFVSERFRSDGAWSRPTAADFISAPGAPVDSHAEANPAPAIHDRGDAVVAWTQENGAGHSVVFLAQRDGWGRWTNPADLADSFSQPRGAARCVQTTFGRDGSLYVVWFEESPDQHFSVWAAHRAPDGTWVENGHDAVSLGTEGADAIHPVVAVGEEGQALVAFVERTGDRWDLVVRRRNPGGAAWLSAEVLSADLPGDASEPAVAWRNDTFVVAWVHGEPLDGRIQLARVTPTPPP